LSAKCDYPRSYTLHDSFASVRICLDRSQLRELAVMTSPLRIFAGSMCSDGRVVFLACFGLTACHIGVYITVINLRMPPGLDFARHCSSNDIFGKHQEHLESSIEDLTLSTSTFLTSTRWQAFYHSSCRPAFGMCLLQRRSVSSSAGCVQDRHRCIPHAKISRPLGWLQPMRGHLQSVQ
jgi:hypothetical protein